MTRLSLLVATLVVPQLATAQFGGLVKKVKDKVTSSSSSTTTGTPTGKVSVAISSDVVDRFITGFQAERAERDRQEAQHANDPIGQTYAARDLIPRCDSMKKADSVYGQKIQQRVMTGDQQAVADLQKWFQNMPTEPLHVKCNNNRAHGEGGFFEMLNAVQARQDTVGAKAGGFSVAEYAAVREKIAAYVLWTYSDPSRSVIGYTPEERSALDAKKPQLYALLQRDYNVGGMPKPMSQL